MSRIHAVSRPLLPLLAAILLAGCGDSGTGGGDGGGTLPIGGAHKVRFLVIGDAGTGDSAQTAVGSLMQQVCANRGCDFVLVTGDNFYEMGVSSASDSQFDTAFRTPYKDVSVPFFVSLGNHDNSASQLGEGSNNSKGTYEVDYSFSTANIGQKFNMPDRYYGFTWPRLSLAPTADFIAIDASPITHYVNDTSMQWSGDTLSTYIAGQKVFIDDHLAASRARWKFAFAHHPYVSNGQHGNAGSFEMGSSSDLCQVPLAVSDTCRGADYKKFLEDTICNKVDVFFTGHDHNLYWLQPTAACGKTQFILSGAGGKMRTNDAPTRNPTYYQVGSITGLFWIELDGDRFTGEVYTVTNGVSTMLDALGKPAPVFSRSFTRQP
jgi:tartrate-resistant acid phosphatase type 5